MRAMIVDDSLLLRSMVERAVRGTQLGFENFVHATDGMDAVQVLRAELRAKQRLDLIVTDTNMPKMSGLEFMELIQRENLCPTARIIMITTENSPAHVARAKAAGSSGNISKPFTPEQVKLLLAPLFASQPE